MEEIPESTVPSPVATITAVTSNDASNRSSKPEERHGRAFEEVVRDQNTNANREDDVPTQNSSNGVNEDNGSEIDGELANADKGDTSDQEDTRHQDDGSIALETEQEQAAVSEISTQNDDKTDKQLANQNESGDKSEVKAAQYVSVSERVISLQTSETNGSRDANSQNKTGTLPGTAAEQIRNSLNGSPASNGAKPTDNIGPESAQDTDLTMQRAKNAAFENLPQKEVQNTLSVNGTPDGEKVPDTELTKRADASFGMQPAARKNAQPESVVQAMAGSSLFNEAKAEEVGFLASKDSNTTAKFDLIWPRADAHGASKAPAIAQATLNTHAATLQQSAGAAEVIQNSLKFDLSKSERKDIREMSIGSVDGADVTTQQTRQITQTIASRGDLPVSIARQVAEALHRSPNKTIELSLSPAELGRVRMTLKTAENNMMVTVLTERPETLDLMRRNIEMLDRAMADLGYENTSFSFQHGTTNENATNENSDQRQDDTNPLAIDMDALPDVETAGTPLQSLSTRGGGLDIRL